MLAFKTSHATGYSQIRPFLERALLSNPYALHLLKVGFKILLPLNQLLYTRLARDIKNLNLDDLLLGLHPTKIPFPSVKRSQHGFSNGCMVR